MFNHRYARFLPQDLLAGVTGAVAGAPQAMGFAILAGVSPLYGLYTAFTATVVGAIFSSSILITVGPTNALALVVASAIGALATEDQLATMFVLTFLTGVFFLLIGLLRLGNLTRFVSNAVMTGFITGAAVLIMLGQLDHLNGYEAETHSSIPLVRFWDWLIHLHQSIPTATVIGVLSVAMIWLMHHTRLRRVATLVTMVVTGVLASALGWADVPLVRDMSLIPSGLPGLMLPDLTLAPGLASTAFAMAILGAVQSAALIQATPNPDGTKVNISRDFAAMGTANVIGGFFQGMPACASLSRTAVNVSAGGRTRMSNVYAGVFVGLILIVFGGLIELIPLAALAGHLIVAAASLIKPADLQMAWRVGRSGQVAMVTTLMATLVLPLEWSIYIGVVLSLLLYVYTSADNIQLTRMVAMGDGRFRRANLPETLPPNEAVILSVQGHLFFAAVYRLEALLPDASTADGTVVILRVRDNRYLGITGIQMLHDYAETLATTGGRLLLSGVSPEVYAQLERTGALHLFGTGNVFVENDIVFDSTLRAYAESSKWLSSTTPHA
ncbi:MAG: SulP family inorganic anion transporter [Chloroflexota bacterium]